MATLLANDCYCCGTLKTENLEIKSNLIMDNLDIHNIDADIVSAQSLIGDDVTCDRGDITSLQTDTINLNNQSISVWQDLITNGYIDIPQPPDPPTPPTPSASIISEGQNILYDDINNSNNNIISSNPIYYGDEPYHYCKPTTWASSTKNTYQYPIIEIQNPVVDYYNPAYYNITYHNFRMVPVKEDEASTYNIHDNSLFENITNTHGKTYKYIHSDTNTLTTIDNSEGDFLGIIRLYNTTDRTITYDIVVRTHSIYCNDEELAIPFNLTNVACYGYYKSVNHEYYPQELIIVSTSSDNNEYWNIMVIKNGDIYFTRTITESDKPAVTYEWQKSHYPCVFHFGNNDNTLMVVIKSHYIDTNYNGINHFTLAYTQGNNVPLARYDNASWDYYSNELYVGRRMRLKQYFTTDGYVVLADDWNYDADNGENDMTYEHYNGNYPVIEVITPANEHSFDFSPAHWFIKTSTQTTIAHNFIVKGIITFQFTSTESTSVPGNDDNHYLVIFKCDDQNYDIWSWSVGSSSSTDLTITTNTSTPIYNNSSRFTTIYNPYLPHVLTNRIDLHYINWNCRSPYIIYSTASPYNNPHNSSDSRTYYVSYYQLYNINNSAPSSQSSTYIIPPYLINNKCLCSNLKIF